MSLNVAIIGCGAIGQIITQSIERGSAGEGIRIVGVFDIIQEKANYFAKILKTPFKIYNTFSELIHDPEVTLVVEAASQEAVREYAVEVIRAKKDLMVLSVGAFSDDLLFSKIQKLANMNHRKIYIPSGAILGLDGVKSAAIGTLTSVNLITRKPVRTLETSKYVLDNKISLDELSEPITLYEGTARDAAKNFPKSVNVSMILSLAGIGADRTIVKVIADPTIAENIHEIHIKGDFGEAITRSENIPCPENPKTSYLAALSAVRTLKNISTHVCIGA